MPPIGRGQGAESAADCLYSSDFYLSALYRLCARVLPGSLGTEDLARVPRIQMCCSTRVPQELLNYHHSQIAVIAELDPNQAVGPGTIRR